MIGSNDTHIYTQCQTNDTQEDTKTSSGEAFVDVLSNLVDDKDVMTIIECQRNMLSRFEKTNEMLVNCNALAVIRFETTNRDLKRYTQQLVDLQKDLDSVYHRIKFLKLKLNQQFPESFKAFGNAFNALDEEEEVTEDMRSVKIDDKSN